MGPSSSSVSWASARSSRAGASRQDAATGARDIHRQVKDEISRRFVVNLARVRGLITSYEQALPGVQGRPTVATTDILRGAVVFLHASLEDLLRSILEWKLPSTAKPEHLDDVPLDGERLRKYTLGDVARHPGTTVDDLIDRSVKAWANSVETFGKAVLALL